MALENLQQLAVEKYDQITISAYQSQLQIDRSTHFLGNAKIWLDAETILKVRYMAMLVLTSDLSSSKVVISVFLLSLWRSMHER